MSDCPEKMDCSKFMQSQSAANVYSTFNYKNQEAPSITCQPDTIVSADPNSCGATFQLRNPRLNNSCNTGVTFSNNAPSTFPVGMTFVVFTAKDSCNHTATCTVKVTVIEDIPPQISCPANVTVDCSVNTDDLTKFGVANAGDNCPGVVIIETVTRSQNICGIGSITRKFVAIDASGNRDSCFQTIVINNADPLEDQDINWPTSPITIDECESIDPANTGFPSFDTAGISCFKPLITYVDTNLCRIRNTCDIERTWTIFDSCSNATFNFVQLIIRDDPNSPNILGVSDTTVYANDSTCNNFIILKAHVDNCDSASIIITNDSPYGFNDFEDASGFYPPGVTTVVFTAEDACCNISSKSVRITVIDTVAPEFTCRKVVKKIRDNGCADFNARDFIARIHDNCTDSILIKSSFDRNDFNDTIRTICCDSITNFEYTTAVVVYFMDFAGNMDSCKTFLQAVDQDTICGITFSSHVKGLVQSRKGTYMPGIDVMLNDGINGLTQTRTDGFMDFTICLTEVVIKWRHNMILIR